MTCKHALWLTWFALACASAGFALAATTGPWSPGVLNGCRIVDATPTYPAGALVAQTCNVNGQLRVTTS